MLRRMMQGISKTIGLGVIFSLWAMAGYCGRPDALQSKYATSLEAVVGMYLGLSVFSGAILGLLRPYATSQMRMAFVSIPVALPSALAVMFLSRDAQLGEMTLWDLFGALILAAIAGPLVAAYMYARGHISEPGPREN